VGLAQFLPGILLFLVSGHAADRFNRRTVLLLTYVGFLLCSCLLLEYSMSGTHSIALIYGIMVLSGVVRSFSSPSSRAILPQLISEEHFPNAVAWNGSIFQGATIMGPAAGGFIYALSRGPSAVYGTAIAAAGVAILLMLRVKLATKPRAREPVSAKTVLAGLEYIWRQKLILGSISLDLFAVLLGGAVALLPVYAIASGVPAAEPTRGCDDVVVRRRIRTVHDTFRTVAKHRAIDGFAAFCRRDRHGECRGARNAGAGRHAG
jgi:MFS family permease